MRWMDSRRDHYMCPWDSQMLTISYYVIIEDNLNKPQKEEKAH
jgi:hypothetical protein